VTQHLIDLVDPMTGTVTTHPSSEHGLGKCFPGACTPFGMIQLSPDTITGGDNSSGYNYDHDTIEGFSLLHMSGTGWYGEFGNLLITPTTGPLRVEKGDRGRGDGYRSRFRHATEVARPGYYAVTLDDYDTRVEVTAAPRAGMLRLRFPSRQVRRVQFDLARRVAGTSTSQSVRVAGERRIEGVMHCTPEGGGWGDGRGKAHYNVYFVAEFDTAFTDCGTWSANIPDDWPRRNGDVQSPEYRQRVREAAALPGDRQRDGRHVGVYVEFDPTPAPLPLLLRVGVSFTSIASAEANLRADADTWNFDAMAHAASDLWRDAFRPIRIEGGDNERRVVFATALYHTMIDPRSVTDADGTFVDARQQRRTARGYVRRTVFSGWDVFRSQMPLQAIIRPDIVSDTLATLTDIADEGISRGLPRWELLGRDTPIMLGDPALSVLADAIQKGVEGIDVEAAWRHIAWTVFESDHPREVAYRALGWCPNSLSWTLETLYRDYCAAVIARSLGHHDAARALLERSGRYALSYDPEVGNMRARDVNGAWLPWEGRTKQLSQGCVESNPWQQGWFVPHDVPGLIRTMGGREAFIANLSEFFDRTPSHMLWNEYHNHSNEPVHHVPYLFTYAGAAWLTQKWSRFVAVRAYKTGPYGLIGNEDEGQMSAWYVLTSVGLHPVCPGDGLWMLTGPMHERCEVRLPAGVRGAGNTFAIVAHDHAAERPYIRRARLNGRALERAWLHHGELAGGGELELWMSEGPEESFGSGELPPAAVDLVSQCN
jgi:predicted alpha-1,2-mannosidase